MTVREADLVLLLADAARNRLVLPLPDDVAPASLADGYANQAAVLAALGERPIGWKLGMTNAEAQRLRGLDGPLLGRLVASRRHGSPASFARDELANPFVEAEFGFVFARAVDASGDERDARAAVLDAVDCLVPAIEVVDARLADWRHRPPALSLSDNLGLGALLLGAPVADWSAADLPSAPVRLSVNGQERASGTGELALGDPVQALVWLARNLHGRGGRIEAGDVVITGTCTGVQPIVPGDAVRADFGIYGEVQLHFEP